MEPIIYLKNKQSITTGTFNTTLDYGNEYAKVYFRIKANYYHYPFTDYPGRDQDKDRFYSEVKEIFDKLGWKWNRNDKRSGIAPEVFFEKETLYLHPLQFAGVIRKNNIKKLAENLINHKTFKLEYVDVYETYRDISSEEYVKYLETCKNSIRIRLLAAATPFGMNKYVLKEKVISTVVSDVYIPRIESTDIDELSCLEGPTFHFVNSIFEELEAEGRIKCYKNMCRATI